MRWRDPPTGELADEEVVTQYGQISRTGVDDFKDRPVRPDRVNGLSMFRGKGSVKDLVARVARKRAVRDTDAVRHTTVGLLRNAGFAVHRAPSPGFPEHLCVTLLDEDAEWTDDDAKRFDGCFTEKIWGESGL